MILQKLFGTQEAFIIIILKIAVLLNIFCDTFVVIVLFYFMIL